MRESDQEILNHYLHVLPVLRDLSINSVGMSLTDRKKFILYKPSRDLNFKAQAGDAIKPGSAVHQAMESRSRVVLRIDKELYGQPYVATGMPIFNEAQEVIGAIAITQTVDRENVLKEMADKLKESISELVAGTQQISAQAEEISAVSVEMSESANKSNIRVNETEQVIRFIKTIASQTNLLGLNAAIEAARVGDLGRGFGVVANEIRKLSTDTAESIKKIEEIMRTIQLDSNHSCKQSEQVNHAISEVAQAAVHSASTVQQVSQMAEELDELASNLMKDNNK